MSKKIDYDIVVIGGGLAGGLAAIALARLGLDCAIIDAVDPAQQTSDSFDGRTTAIAYAGGRLMQHLGLWPLIEAEAEPIREILVTDGVKAGHSGLGTMGGGGVSGLHMHFDSADLSDTEPLGWIVENRFLRRGIYDIIQSTDGIDLISPAKVLDIRPATDHALVRIEGHDDLRARLVVAADGRLSPSRARAGIKTITWQYPQTGIVTTVAHAEPHGGVAQELFLPAGPFAILPMTQNRSSLVWTEKSQAAPAYLALDDARFLGAIRARFGDYLGQIELAGPRWSYPLAFHLAQSFVSDRMVLIGDAARAIHPIAGQGYNLGLKDIAALHDVVRDTAAVGLDIGARSGLDVYEQWRRSDSTMLALGTDVLNRMFSNDDQALRAARRIGLGAVNAAAPLRRMFMKQAGADLGALPSLLRPVDAIQLDG